MNTPNKLTVLRIMLVPVFLVLLLISEIPHNFLWAGIVFGAAGITDYFDGKIARQNNLITDFGKFLDPLADKMLVCAALIAFVELRLVGGIVVIIIISREFMVTSLRLIASGNGEVIAANIWGKVKTITQIVSIVLIMVVQEALYLGLIPKEFKEVCITGGNLIMWVVAIITLASGFTYIWDNRIYIKNAK